ncbi:hypothetical protein B0H14DRAFT_3519278 [Mycena olivaceomarginata]|nr:hypothetical protein B0H14DRAFT_3519278 [Mycena olivaceomarginata]
MSLTFSRIASESKDSKSKDSKSPTVPGPSLAITRIGEQINGVINGWPYFVLRTPSPKEHPPLDFTSRRVPHFNNPTYIDARSAYLMFIPKHDPWHGPLLGVLEYTWDSLPIEEHTPGRWCLKHDTLMAWGEFDAALRSFARGVISLLGNRIPPDGCPWGSPFHFGFGITRKSEHNARAAAWNARRGFLPLLGFLSMGLWCMRYHAQNKEDANTDGNAGANLGKRKRAEGEHVPWQVLLAQETGLHASWIDWAETSVAGDWTAPRVGGLFHVGPTNTHDWLPEELTGLEWLLDTIIDEQPNIPLYFHWGVLPPYQIHSTKYLKSRRFLPDLEEMDYLEALPGRVTFNPWNMLGDGTFESAVLAAASPLPLDLLFPLDCSNRSLRPQLQLHSLRPLLPSPALLPSCSTFRLSKKIAGQKAGESLDAFFLRRQAENSRRSERESLNDRQARAQREAHAQKGLPPGKRGSRVYYWEKDSGHYIRYAAGRGNYEAYFKDYPPAQRRYDSFKDEWDLCSAFGDDDRPGDDDPPDDNDEPVESGDVVLTDRDLVPRHDWRDPFPDDDENDTYYNERLPEMFRPTGAAEVSAHALTRIYLKATSTSGQDPEQENSAQGQPVYEQIATNVLHALNLRFGFVEGHNRPPALAAAFFAQCLQGSSPGDIAVSLFDFHQATSALHRPWPYEISDHGCRIGSDVLLLHNAADVLEIIRQEWGPRVKDVARHLLLRGMTFWMAIVSSEIMHTTQPTASSIRQARLNARFDVRAGLGYRAPGYKADNHDYHAYFVQRNSLLHTSRGSVALQYGGVIAGWRGRRCPKMTFSMAQAKMFTRQALTDREIGILCGVYHVGTGEFDSGANAEQMSHLSWWPKPNAWASGNLYPGWWTPHCEEWYQNRVAQMARGDAILLNPRKWKHGLKYDKRVKECLAAHERISAAAVLSLLSA